MYHFQKKTVNIELFLEKGGGNRNEIINPSPSVKTCDDLSQTIYIRYGFH
jgi:hypothetical protein